MARKLSTPNVVIRRTWKIGAPDAESDQAFLETCFVDNGALDELRDCNEPRRIVVGRTGIGKTALLTRLLQTEDNVRTLPPEVLSLTYISNSQIIQFLEEIGAHLELFYKVLWDHVLAIELIRWKFDINNKTSFGNFVNNALPTLTKKSNARDRAVSYLKDWGDKFWEETEYRVKEFTTKLENDMRAALSAGVGQIKLNAEAAKSLTSEQKGEILQRANDTVNKVQIQELHAVISLLSDFIFTDTQQKYFITIDRLDEDWVDNSIRYKLIKALIESVRNFQKIRSVKIVISLRTDLLQRVLRHAVTPGFQDEKFEALYLKLRWSPEELEEILDRRIDHVFKKKYTRGRVCINDVLPSNQMEKTSALGYIFQRTSLRPREAIMFINECIERAEGRTKFTVDIIRSAEVSYSQKRVVSLMQEWNENYPNLQDYLSILKNKTKKFTYDMIDEDEIMACVASASAQQNLSNDELVDLGKRYIQNENDVDAQGMKNCWLSIMYRVGVLGIKPEPTINVQWSYLDAPEIPESFDLSEMEYHVHPEYWNGLGISSK